MQNLRRVSLGGFIALQQFRAAFNKEFGVTFPVLLDDTETYPVSNAYGLTNVPTIFWIAQDAEIADGHTRSARQDARALGTTARYIGEYLEHVLLGDQSAHLRLWVHRVADAHGADARDQPLEKGGLDRALP